MKTVKIKRMSLLNFKGIRNRTIDFGDVTEIKGDNATGKTTIMDAFIWLLFGKDSTDRKDFEIKTLDGNNNPISKIDHIVSAILEVDGTTMELSRQLREKWVKRRGSEDAEFTGHETLFYIDDVPMQAGEYSNRIGSIINESLFKMITNPHYFNSMKWQDRRTILTEIAGNIQDFDIAKSKEEFQKLLKDLSGKSFDEFRRSINAKKKVLKDDLDQIPARIDEVNRSIPEEPDYNAVKSEIATHEKSIQGIDGQILDASKRSEAIFQKRKERQEKIHALQSRQNEILFAEQEKGNKEYREKQAEISKLKDEIDSLGISGLQERIEANKSRVEYLEEKIEHKRNQWNEENNKQLIFDPGQFICPACKRPFEASDIEAKKAELTENFNRSKIEKLEQIQKEGLELTGQVESIKKDNETLNVTIRDNVDKSGQLKEKLNDLQSQPNEKPQGKDSLAIPEYAELQRQIDELQSQGSEGIDTSELQKQKKELQLKLDDLKTKMSTKGTVEKLKARITELEKESREKSQTLADLEKQEFIMNEFERVKIDMIEKRINEMFSIVKFKMFSQLINGGTEPTCQTLINGVPWTDANNAGRINGGLDIINALCNYYEVSAPVFIDNSESVVKLINGNFQLIKLIVDANQKQLSVSSKQSAGVLQASELIETV